LFEYSSRRKENINFLYRRNRRNTRVFDFYEVLKDSFQQMIKKQNEKTVLIKV
jgi:hypothetical protein